MTRMPAFPTGGNSPIALKDKAESFTESDVTLTGVDKNAVSGSIRMGPPAESNTYNPDTANSGDGDVTVFDGTPAEWITSLDLTIQGSISGPYDADLLDVSSSTVIETVTGVNGGEVVSFSGPMEPGTRYAVKLKNTSGDSWGSPAPKSSVFMSDTNFLNAVTEVSYSGPTPTSVTVEWPYPTDIYRWDAATFVAAPDGGTVDIFVEDAAGNELAGPIERGDEIPATPDGNPQFRVDFSRTDSSQRPELKSIYRRWVV